METIVALILGIAAFVISIGSFFMAGEMQRRVRNDLDSFRREVKDAIADLQQHKQKFATALRGTMERQSVLSKESIRHGEKLENLNDRTRDIEVWRDKRKEIKV
jgi:hypothetical protein